MNHRKWIVLVVVLVLAAGAAEMAVHPWRASTGCVQIVNQGDVAIEDLVLSYSGTKVRLGRLGAGESSQAWFSAAKLGPLDLAFRQKGNPLPGFRVEDFDPATNIREGLKLVLYIKNDRVERAVDDDDTVKARENTIQKLMNWFLPEPKLAP